jgi:hypothetical protein
MQGSTHIAGLANNIILDGASAYKWEVLNETVFLTKFFECLRESMGAEFFSYTFYILSSHDPEILPQSAADASRRKILFFISDESSSVPVALQSHYLAIFKSYLPHELPGSNIFPFNIGYVRDVPEIMPKPIQSRANNVFFSGNMNNNRFPLYRELHPILKRLPYRIAKALFYGMQRGRRHLSKETDFGASFPKSYIRFTDGFKHGLSPESYGRMLYDSKIVLCPRGFSSSETFRHMEALRAGAIVISERLPDTHFYRGSPIVSVRDWRAGLEMAREIIADPKLLEGLHLETTKWWHRICSEAATATYIKNQLHQLERVRLPDDS